MGSPMLLGGIGDQSVSSIINTILAVLIAIDIHEIGHALVADRLGDDTPRRAGHISLNPFRHMDQFGIVMLVVTALSGMGFTYGFTPISEGRLRERSKFGPAIVALAGPVMNLLLAVLVAIPLARSTGFVFNADGSTSYALAGNAQLFDFVFQLFVINVFLFVFNLVPFPPLDGWRILSEIMTPKLRYDLRQVAQYGPLILLVLFIFEPQIHFFASVIDPITTGLETRMLQLWGGLNP